MSSLSAFYFPDTLPPPAVLSGLRALPIILRGYQPLPDAKEQVPPPWAQFIGAGQLELVSPPFISPELSARLRSLIREIDQSKGELAQFMARNLLAEFSAQREETAPELIAPLLGQFADTEATKARENLWQALLLLKLAENLEIGEMELTEKLRELEAARALLLRRLTANNEENQLDENNQVNEENRGIEVERRAQEGFLEIEASRDQASAAPVQPARPWRDSLRLLKAWGYLFLRQPPELDLLLSADPEAWSLLHDTALTDGLTLSALGSLLLPSTPLQADDDLAAALKLAISQGESQGAVAAINAWNQAISERGVESSWALDLTLLPNTSLPELVARSCQQVLPEKYSPPKREEHPHGLIALFRALPPPQRGSV